MNNKGLSLTTKILIGMLVGIVFGLLLRIVPTEYHTATTIIGNIFTLGGNIFIALMKMLVVPIVLVSIACGICSLENLRTLGSLGIKTFFWFIVTLIAAMVLALVFAEISQVGDGVHLAVAQSYHAGATPSLWEFVNNIVTDNPFKAMLDANVLQVIVFAILLGLAINTAGEAGRKIADFFLSLNEVLMRFILMLLRTAPYGVFCLIAKLFAEQGFDLVWGILNYFLLMLFVLFLHTFFTYGILLRLANLPPKIFFRKIYALMLFAFGVSSSNASIPLALDTVEHKLGVSNTIAAFVIPLGINMNKNGTAIMQVIAAVFIAHVYHIEIGLLGDLILLLTTLLISIGTAGAPGIGIVSLVMILKQLGLPLEGIAIIIGVDRLLDMARTAVNVTGNAAVACLVAQSEKQLDQKIYYT